MNRKILEEKTDAELAELSQNESIPGAYAELIKRHYSRCFRRAHSILSEPADAEDAVQDALVRALLKLDQLQNHHSFGGWLDRIVVSCCVSKVRRKHPEMLDLDDYEAALEKPEDDDNPEGKAVAQEREEAVFEAINELPDKYRDPIWLFHLRGQSYKDIAEVLDLPLGTVQSLISRAREKLEEMLKPYYRTALYAY